LPLLATLDLIAAIGLSRHELAAPQGLAVAGHARDGVCARVGVFVIG